MFVTCVLKAPDSLLQAMPLKSKFGLHLSRKKQILLRAT